MQRQATHLLRSSLIRDVDLPVQIPVDDIMLMGDLYVPKVPTGVVIFAHGSGSSRHSPRNKYVADVLHEYNMGTLLVDLLTREEERIDEATRELRFNIPMLASRLAAVNEWTLCQPVMEGMRVGYFGASTGAGAALVAAARHPEYIAAVVSRGGRPDLAGQNLYQVRAPTLLVVGGNDKEVLALNESALQMLNNKSRLDIIPKASHLFEEPGVLEDVAHLAGQWFSMHFV